MVRVVFSGPDLTTVAIGPYEAVKSDDCTIYEDVVPTRVLAEWSYVGLSDENVQGWMIEVGGHDEEVYPFARVEAA